jgi:hypothetical protein
MSGMPVTPLRMTRLAFSAPYMDETMGFVVNDHLRGRFVTWDSIREMDGLEISMPDLPYDVAAIRERLPKAQLRVFNMSEAKDPAARKAEVFAGPAERGAASKLIDPRYTVVIPAPGLIEVPLA